VIIAVGDELLRGDTIDTNGAWLGRTLAASGISVRGRTVVGDDPAEIAAAIRTAASAADLVLVCGGLGPTRDDRTREALADVLGEPLQADPRLAAVLTHWYAARDRPMPAAATVQAERPASAAAVPNAHGSAPGLMARVAGATVVLLPGPPRELRPMATSVLAGLRPAGGARASRLIQVALLPESVVAERAEAVAGPVDLAYYAAPGRVQVRLAGAPPSELAAAEERIRAALGDVVLDAAPAAAALAALERRGWTLAVAESLTGGAVAAALTDVPGASRTLRGGVVAYATDVKSDLLGVPEVLLAERGPVDPEVARWMASGVAGLLAADVAVATTGVAGPDPVGDLAPGLAFVAVVGPGFARVVRVTATGDRELVRRVSVAHALDALRRAAAGLPAYAETAEPG
jgi:nicotinamide-nucleotide amidase